MTEFGSDFHRCDLSFRGESKFLNILGGYRCYANGRQAIEALIKQEGWKRMWIPAYFCYEVIEHLSKHIAVELYDDNPLVANDDARVRSLAYKPGDVLLRMNFFGTRSKRSNSGIPVPVIEDHTHDIISSWAIYSDADYCIASLRKSLPLAAGGILWSPKKHQLPEVLVTSDACEEMAAMRYEAMELKSRYLNEGGDKEAFRQKYIQSDEMLEALALSGIDKQSEDILLNFDFQTWVCKRILNWQLAYEKLHEHFEIVRSYDDPLWEPFSLVILCKTPEERMNLKQYLIQHQIYPAVLWTMPEDSAFKEALNFSQQMLSVHCDARYEIEDIEQMCDIINGFYD